MDKIDLILWVIGGGFTLMLAMWHNMNTKFAKIDDRFISLEKDIGQINTRLTVVENKIIDINTNLTRLMWQQQSPPSKEEHQ